MNALAAAAATVLALGLLAACTPADPAAAAAPAAAPPVRTVSVPPALQARSRCEPSGLAWLADLDRLLMVSDDTGHDGAHDHAPWLFLVDRDGRVEEQPLILHGVDEINDLEAIASGDHGRLWLVSSQSASRHGKRPMARQALIEVTRAGRTLTATRRIALHRLVSALPAMEVAALGLGEREADGSLALEIEGAAWRDGALFLGLKRPLGTDGALLWRIGDVAGLMAGRLVPGQVTLHARIDLGGRDGRRAGIADLAFAADGRLLVLANLPEAPAARQLGTLQVVDRLAPGLLVARQLAAWPGRQPEGLAPIGDGRWLVVFDEGAATPLSAVVAVP